MKYGILNPGEKKEFSIIIYTGESQDLESKQEKLKKIEAKKEIQSTKLYWKKYLKSHMGLNLADESAYTQKIENIYKRTILLFPLLANAETRRVFSCNGNR